MDAEQLKAIKEAVDREVSLLRNQMEQERAQNNANNANQQIARVSAKIPEFWKNRPKLWFAQVEANFQTSGIVADETKFNTLVASIDASILECCEDVVTNPPAVDKYQTLKECIIKEYTGSEMQRVNKLLSELQLGDRKPSRLLSEMENLAGENILNDALETIFLAKLPRHTAEIIGAATGTLKQRALVGDKVQEIGSMGINAVATTPSSTDSELIKLLKSFNEKIDGLVNTINNDRRPRNRSKTPASNRGRSTENSKICWKHRKFGDKAHSCIQPCEYRKSDQNQGN